MCTRKVTQDHSTASEVRSSLPSPSCAWPVANKSPSISFVFRLVDSRPESSSAVFRWRNYRWIFHWSNSAFPSDRRLWCRSSPGRCRRCSVTRLLQVCSDSWHWCSSCLGYSQCFGYSRYPSITLSAHLACPEAALGLWIAANPNGWVLLRFKLPGFPCVSSLSFFFAEK